MASYEVALGRVNEVAALASKNLQTQWISIHEAVGKVVAKTLYSPVATPKHDTSAMDGYAVPSSATRHASIDHPVVLEVRGTIAAGDDPERRESHIDSSTLPCLEIMTGGVFPTKRISGHELDACIKIEETSTVADATKARGRLIKLTRSVTAGEHKRIAGDDVTDGATLLEPGTTVQPQHILVLASLAVTEVCVWTQPRIGLWSSGKEIATIGPGHIPDANGPYLTAALAEAGAHVSFLGTLPDDACKMATQLRRAAESEHFDLLVTTGGVSVGKFDFLSPSLRSLGAAIEFHGLRIRPGHPVLFGTIPSRGAHSVPILGLPGNPGAAAACFQFLVRPFIKCLLGKPPEKPVIAKLLSRRLEQDQLGNISDCTSSRTLFKHGKLRQTPEGGFLVEMSKEQSPAKLAPYLDANCWIQLDEGKELDEEELHVAFSRKKGNTKRSAARCPQYYRPHLCLSAHAPSAKADFDLSHLGRSEVTFLVPPSEPRLKTYDLNSRHCINHAPFDGKFTNSFANTSLHLSFTDFEKPLDVGSRGLRDTLAVLVKSLVSVDDGGDHIGDLDVLSMFNRRRLTIACCEHQALEANSGMARE
ncbi:hypothetical protein BN1723_005975 [Verticillium longisporum]|uniref:molybdopterin adenylyltransferase n=1 Tax=Verticillium longisporum TaxID=100787 RepID=A0A0G4NCA1_VERLO|nr:hypothetical protein BN1723_005975 [Verticillium longisporum]